MKLKLLKIKNNDYGQSLVEVIVALGISVVIVTGFVTITNNSLKSIRINRIRSVATQLANDALEIARRDKQNWSQFTSLVDKYCLDSNDDNFIGDNDADLNDTAFEINTNCLDSYNFGSSTMEFDRTVNFSLANKGTSDISDDEMTVKVIVTWDEGSVGQKSVDSTTVFTNWK